MSAPDYEARIAHLREFYELLGTFIVAIGSSPDRPGSVEARDARSVDLRRQLNRMIPRVRRYLNEARLQPVMVSYPAPAVGGAAFRFDLLENLFIDNRLRDVRPEMLFDYLDRAIGLYEDLVESGETLEGREMSSQVGIIGALQSKLRPLLREEPENEKVVQDAVESLLTVLDVPFTREAEALAYSSKAYRPDFVLKESDTALEIKLCKGDREKRIIGEMNDDIIAYRTKHENALFLVYDVGAIRDEQRFRADIESQSRVLVLVVKH